MSRASKSQLHNAVATREVQSAAAGKLRGLRGMPTWFDGICASTELQLTRGSGAGMASNALDAEAPD